MWKQFMEWFSSFRKSEDVKEVASKMVHIVVEKAEQKALKCGQICCAAGDAEAEAHGKITEPDGEAVAQSPQEMSFWHNQISPLLDGSSGAQRAKRHYMTGRDRSKEKLPDRS